MQKNENTKKDGRIESPGKPTNRIQAPAPARGSGAPPPPPLGQTAAADWPQLFSIYDKIAPAFPVCTKGKPPLFKKIVLLLFSCYFFPLEMYILVRNLL